MWFFLWALFIALVDSRPQAYQFDQSRPNVELAKQDILHVTFNSSIRDEAAQRRIEANTKEILEKIEALNKKQGLTKKKKPSYLHFPFSYSRSQQDSENGHQTNSFPSSTDEKINFQQMKSSQDVDTRPNFQFPVNPFQNPIFEYLQKQQVLPTELKASSVNSPSGFVNIIQTNPNARITEEDKIPGEFIQRKITHQQTMIIPSVQTYWNNQYNADILPSVQDIQRYGSPMNDQIITDSPITSQKQNNKVSALEKQTINNIKNIVWNSQSPIPQLYPYISNFEQSYQPLYVIPQISNYAKIGPDQIENQTPAILYGPYVVPNLGSALPRQFQSPLQNYFPMVIKDPLVQLFNAFTTMIEYGPQAGSGTGCKTKNDENPEDPDKSKINKGIHAELGELDEQNEEIEQEVDSTTNNILDLSNLTITEHDTSLVDGTELQELARGSIMNTRSPKGKVREELIIMDKKTAPESNSKLSSKTSNFNIKDNHVEKSRPFVKINHRPFQNEETSTVKIELADTILRRGTIPLRRDQILNGEKVFGLGNTKPSYTSGEDVKVSNDGNKKLFSKDNTGSGIFIHKLKVRRGGVAIAGPGGIATAGEGGTAIVGPNGYAYTQPDSLAIAGTGTKVIAVEPSVNLSELIKNNKTRLGGAHPQRFGKVVAVGPVIYYNKG